MEHSQEHSSKGSSSNNTNANEVLIVKGAATLGNQSYSPNPITVEAGSTVTRTNVDKIIHTVLAKLTLSRQENYLTQA